MGNSRHRLGFRVQVPNYPCVIRTKTEYDSTPNPKLYSNFLFYLPLLPLQAPDREGKGPESAALGLRLMFVVGLGLGFRIYG